MGYTTWGLPRMPIDEALRHLARLGFDGVEIAVIRGFTTELDTLDTAERRRIRHLLDEHGLELTAVGGHASLLSRGAGAHAENWRRLTGAVDLCVDWAGPQGPPVHDTVLGSSPETWDGGSTARSVELLAPLAAQPLWNLRRCNPLPARVTSPPAAPEDGASAVESETPSAFAAGGTPRPGGAERSLGWAYLAAAGRLKTGASGVESGALKR